MCLFCFKPEPQKCPNLCKAAPNQDHVKPLLPPTPPPLLPPPSLCLPPRQPPLGHVPNMSLILITLSQKDPAVDVFSCPDPSE